MKDNNPMLELAAIIEGLITDAKEEEVFLGEVKSGYPNLKIKFKDIILEKENLLISSLVKDRLDKKPMYKNDYKYEIKTGDTVVMLARGDKFVIIDKVVSI